MKFRCPICNNRSRSFATRRGERICKKCNRSIRTAVNETSKFITLKEKQPVA